MSDTSYLNLTREEKAHIREVFFDACMATLKKEIPDPDRRARDLAHIIERLTDGLRGVPVPKGFLALNLLIEHLLEGCEDFLNRLPEHRTPPDEPIEGTEVNHGT